jgi:hypothetical protein
VSLSPLPFLLVLHKSIDHLPVLHTQVVCQVCVAKVTLQDRDKRMAELAELINGLTCDCGCGGCRELSRSKQELGGIGPLLLPSRTGR